MKQQNSIREIYGNLRNGAHIHTESTHRLSIGSVYELKI